MSEPAELQRLFREVAMDHVSSDLQKLRERAAKLAGDSLLDRILRDEPEVTERRRPFVGIDLENRRT